MSPCPRRQSSTPGYCSAPVDVRPLEHGTLWNACRDAHWLPATGSLGDATARLATAFEPFGALAAEERAGWRRFMGRYHHLGDHLIVGEHLSVANFGWIEQRDRPA
jgi:hypothetical protein